MYSALFHCIPLFETCFVPASNCKRFDVKLSAVFLNFVNVRVILSWSYLEHFLGRPLLSFLLSNTGSQLIGFFAWTKIWALEYWRNISKSFLPLTLHFWYRDLIWQEFSIDILAFLGIFCWFLLIMLQFYYIHVLQYIVFAVYLSQKSACYDEKGIHFLIKSPILRPECYILFSKEAVYTILWCS